jgi:hypothetical protein
MSYAAKPAQPLDEGGRSIIGTTGAVVGAPAAPGNQEQHGNARARGIAITLDTYSHVMPQQQRDAADILGNALSW